MIKEELWQAVLAQIQLNISSANFATWFRKTHIVSNREGSVTVSVPNDFSKEWLENKYSKAILKILRDIDNEIKEIKYEVISCALKEKQKISPRRNEIQLGFKELESNKETNLDSRYDFDNFVVVDASCDIETVHAQVVESLKKKIF